MTTILNAQSESKLCIICHDPIGMYTDSDDRILCNKKKCHEMFYIECGIERVMREATE